MFLLFTLLIGTGLAQAQTTNWQPVGDRIKTQWASQVDPAKPLPEYPRPHLIRPGWQNLNGLWDYAITPKTTSDTPPAKFDGKILVPFAVSRRCRAWAARWARTAYCGTARWFHFPQTQK